MRIIGITGGIGSGKSTVSRILSNIGAKIIDADVIARKIITKGNKVFDQVVSFFGKEILDEDGELNRKKLSEIVFKDAEKLKALNNITHKYIAEVIRNKIEREKQEKNFETIVVDVPIPFDNWFLDMVDEVWVVNVDRETRIKRIMDRNGLSRDEAMKRILSQRSETEYLNIADKIIDNNSDIKDLEKQVVKLYFNPDRHE